MYAGSGAQTYFGWRCSYPHLPDACSMSRWKLTTRILNVLKPGATHEEIGRPPRSSRSRVSQPSMSRYMAGDCSIEPPRVDIDAVMIRRPLDQFVAKEGMLVINQPNVVTLMGNEAFRWAIS